MRAELNRTINCAKFSAVKTVERLLNPAQFTGNHRVDPRRGSRLLRVITVGFCVAAISLAAPKISFDINKKIALLNIRRRANFAAARRKFTNLTWRHKIGIFYSGIVGSLNLAAASPIPKFAYTSFESLNDLRQPRFASLNHLSIHASWREMREEDTMWKKKNFVRCQEIPNAPTNYIGFDVIRKNYICHGRRHATHLENVSCQILFSPV